MLPKQVRIRICCLQLGSVRRSADFQPIRTLNQPKKTQSGVGGAFVQGVAGFGFGFLTFVNDLWLFLSLSYFLRYTFKGDRQMSDRQLAFLYRLIAGMADAVAWSAVLAIMMELESGSTSFIVSHGETIFGFGLMVGPAVGSLLYNVGGFVAPFSVLGAVAVLAAFAMAFVVPDVGSVDRKSYGAMLKQAATVKCRISGRFRLI